MNNCSRIRLACAFLLAVPAVWCQVQVREDRLNLATYDEGKLDPNPQFPQFFNGEFPNYPYPIILPENKIRHMTAWREVVLENEFLSCRILPDLGGHLHGCTDRVSGKEIFYANPAVRRAGGTRGDFLSMGIESSFPYAHSRADGSPVDFAYSVTDGVGRVVVEDRDLVSGMTWRVEFILRPGVAVLEQNVTLANTGAARQPYHWWANAAVELDDPHLKIVYPVKWMVPHGDEGMMQWPVNNGVDLSDVANYQKAVGLFGHGSGEPWMAVYKPSSRSGVAHYADPRQVPGKKIWLWAEDNKYVLANLTEKFNSYVEMQAGTSETQPEFLFLEPGEVKRFDEYWIPFRDLSGVARVTRDLVLSIKRAGATPAIELLATRHIAGAKIRVLDGTKTVFEATADLDPKANWTKTIDGAPAAMTVDITDRAGVVLLHEVEGQINAIPFDRNAKNPEPVEPPPAGTDTRTQTEAAYLARGLWHERHEQFQLARLDYRGGMARYPQSEALRAAAGRVAFILTRWDEVVPLLAGISYGPAQTEAAYYYGTVLAESTPLRFEARNALKNAMRNPVLAPAARYQLAMLNAREGNLAEAAKVMDRITMEPAAGSGTEPRATAETGAVEVAILRRLGQTEAAKKKLDYWLAKDPADNMLRFEKTLSGVDDAALWTHLAGDPNRVIVLADEYAEMGDWQDAAVVLGRKYPAPPSANEADLGAVLPQDNALVSYFRAYCRTRLGQDPAADLAAAAAQPVLDVFPHRARMYEVLQLAVDKNPNDANAHNLLGDLNFDSADTNAAIAEWGKALALKKDIPALHRNLGRALLEVKHDVTGARLVLMEGARLAPDDTELRELLANASAPSPVLDSKYFEAPLPAPSANRGPAPKQTTAKAPAPSGPAAPAPPKNAAAASVPIPGDLADRALLGSPLDAERAASLFTGENFPKDRPPNEVRRDYIEVQLQRLMARAHAGKCREMATAIDTMGDENKALPFTLYGFGAFTKAAHFQYYLGVVENLCGDEKAAKKRWGRMTKTSETFDSAEDVFPYLALKSLEEKGWQQKMEAGIKAVHAKAGAGEKPELEFIEGTLLTAAGKQAEGDALLQKSFHAEEPMTQYLSLTAMHENSAK